MANAIGSKIKLLLSENGLSKDMELSREDRKHRSNFEQSNETCSRSKFKEYKLGSMVM